jgi:hypothetical protein
MYERTLESRVGVELDDFIRWKGSRAYAAMPVPCYSQ